jgi:hypothetical protein
MTQNSDYKRALEDENGGHIDERSLKNEHRSHREIGAGALFVLGVITVSIGGLYLIGVWVDGVW